MKKTSVSLWSLILMFLITTFSLLIYTGKIMLLIHPKMIVFVYLAIAIMIVLFINSVMSSKKNEKSKGISLFLLPIVLSFIFIASDPFTGIAYNKEIEDHNHVHSKVENEQDVFLRTYSSIEHKEAQEGSIIRLEGLMLNRDGNYISKVLMSCCAADSQIVGIRVVGEIDKEIINKPCEYVGKIIYDSGEYVLKTLSVKEIDDIKKIYIYR